MCNDQVPMGHREETSTMGTDGAKPQLPVPGKAGFVAQPPTCCSLLSHVPEALEKVSARRKPGWVVPEG